MRSLLLPALFATAISPGQAGLWASGDILPEPPAVSAEPSQPRRSLVVEQAPDGLFYVEAQVNGAPVQFVVDSGASVVILNARDAARAGVRALGAVAVDTAGGSAAMRRARLDRVVLAGRTLSSVDAAVVDRSLEVSLLGQSALSQFGAVTFRKSRLELE